jgi:hypothetical protein
MCPVIEVDSRGGSSAVGTIECFLSFYAVVPSSNACMLFIALHSPSSLYSRIIIQNAMSSSKLCPNH